MKPPNREMERANFERYAACAPEGKIEQLDSRIIVGNSLDGSRLLLDHIVRGWSLDAATAFGSPDQWIAALQETYGAISSIDSQPKPLIWQAPDLAHGGDGPDAGHRRIREHLSMSFFEVGESLGGQALGRIVMKLGDDSFTPDLMFFKSSGPNAIHEYYLDGPAEMAIEVVRPAHRDYDVRVKRERYARGGVPEYLIVDPEGRSFQFLRLVEGAYAAQQPDFAGLYRPASIPGLAIRPDYLWVDDDYGGNRNKTNPFVVEQPRGTGARMQLIREGPGSDYLPFEPHVDLHPVPVLFEEFVAWSPEPKFEFFQGRIQLSSEEGVQRMTGLLLATLGLSDACRLAPPAEWLAALRRRRDSEAHEQETRLEWRGRAVQAAETLREKYHAKRVAITGALASPQPFTFWSQPAMAVWGVSSESMQQVYKEFTALNMDVFEADGHWFQRQLDNGEMRIEDI